MSYDCHLKQLYVNMGFLFTFYMILTSFTLAKSTDDPMNAFKLGISRKIITPSPGSDMTGFLLRNNPSEGVLDDINAKSMVITDGKTKLAVITIDCLGMEINDVNDLKINIRKETGIRNILLACSHTHSGPAVMTLHGCGQIDPAYIKFYKLKILESVAEANEQLVPVKLSINKGYSEIGMNRRNRYTTETTYGIDSEIGMIRFDTMDGKPFCLLVNYACHPVILGSDNRKFSRDYPGVLQDYLEEKLKCQVMFLQGAAGDINPVQSGTIEIMNQLGTQLAHQVLNAIHHMQSIETHQIQYESIPVRFPLRQLTSEEIDTAVNKTYSPDSVVQEKFKNAMLEWKESTSNKRLPNYIDAEIVKIRLGDLNIIGIPGELFSGIGLKIKDSYLPETAFVVGYANGNVGYLPTKKAFSEGGYEVDLSYRFYGKKGPFTTELEDIIYQPAKKK